MTENIQIFKEAEMLEKSGRFDEAIRLIEEYKRDAIELSFETEHRLDELIFKIENHKHQKEAADLKRKIEEGTQLEDYPDEPKHIISEIKFTRLSLDQDLDKMKQILHRSQLLVPRFMEARRKYREKAIREELQRRLMFAQKLIRRGYNDRAIAVLNFVSDVAEKENLADLAEKSWKLQLRIRTK